MAADADDDDSDDAAVGGAGGGGGISTPPPPQLFSARSMAFSSAADPLANLTRMLDEQILTGAAAGPTPFASVKQQGRGGEAAAASSFAAAAAAAAPAAAENDDDDDDFSRGGLANEDLSSSPLPRSPYYGADDALARATATPPRGGGGGGGSEFGSTQQQQQQPLLLGIVEHAFDAALPEELSVVPGDRVQVRGEADGWLDCVLVVAGAPGGKREDEEARVSAAAPSGLVPESYVRYVGDVEFAEAGRRQLEEQKLQRQVFDSSSQQLSPQGSLTPRADWLSKPDMLAALVGGGGGGGGAGGGGGGGGGEGGTGSGDGDEQTAGGRALERQTSANPFGAGSRQGQRGRQEQQLAASPRDASVAASAAAAAAASTSASTAFSPPSSSKYRAAFAFSAENDDELSVSEGEELMVLASVDGWVQVENSAGERGLVPESYVEQV